MVRMIQTCLLATSALLPLHAVQLSAVTPRMRPVAYVEKPRELEPDVNLTDDEASIWNPGVQQQAETNVPPPKSGPLANGLVIVKTPKTAGSTIGGALRRLAFKNGLRGSHETNPLDSNTRGPLIMAFQDNRIHMKGDYSGRLSKAFYVSTVREPAERWLSCYNYVTVCHGDGGNEHGVTADQIMGWIKPGDVEKGISLEYFFNRSHDDAQAKFMEAELDSSPHEIMKTYDFVAVTERFDESLVVLARKMGVSKNDLLYSPSKKAGATDCGGCTAYVPLKDRSPEEKKAAERFDSGRDHDLVVLANEALDREIKNYPGFNKDLREFKHQLAVIADECSEYGCDQCMWGGAGCGQLCIEKMIKKHNW